MARRLQRVRHVRSISQRFHVSGLSTSLGAGESQTARPATAQTVSCSSRIRTWIPGSRVRPVKRRIAAFPRSRGDEAGGSFYLGREEKVFLTQQRTQIGTQANRTSFSSLPRALSVCDLISPTAGFMSTRSRASSRAGSSRFEAGERGRCSIATTSSTNLKLPGRRGHLSAERSILIVSAAARSLCVDR